MRLYYDNKLVILALELLYKTTSDSKLMDNSV